MMDTEFHLRAGDCEAGIAPSLGAALTSLTVAGRPLLRSGSVDAIRNDPRAAACFPCVPYFGRIAGALDFKGRQFAMAPTLVDADPHNALHGEGWISSWQVETHNETAITCVYTHTPKRQAPEIPGRFPFSYKARQTVSLSEKAAHFSLSVQNIGHQTEQELMPAGLGLHPHFTRTLNTRISFVAPHFWTPPTATTPGAFSQRPDSVGGGAPAPLPDATRDHSYAEFGGETQMTDTNGATRLTANTPVLHLYAPQGENYFCVEPVSHVPGGFTDLTNQYGGRVLAPGETHSISMTISAE